MRAIWLSIFLLACGEPSAMLDAGATTHDAGRSLDAGFDGGADASDDAGVDGGLLVLEDAGSSVGESCTNSNQCGGATFTCEGFGNSTEQNCAAPCTTPPTFVSNGRLQRADCPSRAVCMPDFNGNTGRCVEECLVDTDCQTDAGYFCRNTFFANGAQVQTANGYCAPFFCRTRGCSSAYQCFC